MIRLIELIILGVRCLNVYDEPPTGEKLQQNNLQTNYAITYESPPNYVLCELSRKAEN
jgi:hypothetical protein